MHKKPVVVALVTLILLGCQAAYQQLPYQQLIDKPKVEFKEKEQKFISYFEVEPIFRFTVDNPNPMGLPIKNMTFNLTILDQKFIAGVSDQGIVARPNSSEIVELALPFNFMDVFDTAEAFKKTAYTRFDLTGEMTIGPFSIPYDISGEFDIPRIPSVTVETINVSHLSPERTRLTITIALKNTNRFPTPSGFLEYSTSVGGVTLGEGWLTPIPTVGARQEKRIIVPIEVAAAQMDGPLGENLKRPTTACVMSGSIRYAVPGRGRRNFPFTNAGEVPVVP